MPTPIPYPRILVMTALVCLPLIAAAQHHHAAELEKVPLRARQERTATQASSWFDVQYYKLDLAIAVNPNGLSGAVTVTGKCLQNNASVLSLDLANVMTIDSVLLNGTAAFFVQRSSWFDVTLDRPYLPGEQITLIIHYRGTPVPTGFGSFTFSSHNGSPWVFSLSEPYGSMDWWPCRNTPSDKADSADIIITCDSVYKVGSQGLLISAADAGNGKRRYHWKTRYPIAPYLISVAMAQYEQWSDYYRYSPTDSLEVLNYILPDHAADARPKLAKTIGMLAHFSALFGPYPFLKEKYGHAEFTGGGMEHQTMTSLGRFDEDIVAHELAHQWFGDMITCRTWSDLWLNEGFAQYSTGLYFEREYGTERFRQYMAPLLSAASSAAGRLGRPDTTNPGALFNFALMYAKGAAVLHMLRRVMGDAHFFQALRAYAGSTALQYSTATTADLRTICQNVSGKDLGPFFDQWLYGENVPTYIVRWEWSGAGDSAAVLVTIEQQAGRTIPAVFTMPLDLRIRAAGKETTVTVQNSLPVQSYRIPFASEPHIVVLDPDGWLLKRSIDGNDRSPDGFRLEQNFPNPFSTHTTIRYHLSRQADVKLTIYDILGREVETLVNGRQEAGVYEVKWVPQRLGSGPYYIVYRAESIYKSIPMLIIN